MRRRFLSPQFVHSTVTLFVVAIATALSSSKATAQNAINGGLLYDKWWVMIGAPTPVGDHPLYPPAGQQSGSGTFRCKECHGWDYKGAAGAYGAGSSHFTGIAGVFGSTLTPSQMFDIIKNPDGDGTGGTTVNGHGYGSTDLTDADINDMVEFLQTLLIDTDTLIAPDGTFLGNATQGQIIYSGVGICSACHGADGTALNFGTPEDPEWVGTVAVANPWEFQHKMRLGQPNSAPQMPSWTEGGGSDQDVADTGLYIQQNFPTGVAQPTVPTVSEWGTFMFTLSLLTAGTLVIGRRRAVAISR